MRPFKTLSLILTVLASTASAQALVPINEEPYIMETLLQGFIGDQIAKECPTIEPRNLRALNELAKLRDYALEKGYSAEEIRNLVRSDEEKAKARLKAAELLKERGAESGNAEAHCAIGEEEIAKDSLLGQLLRSTK